MKNLTAFTKLYGYVKYFYPGAEAQKIDWDKFAIYGSSQIKNASDSKELVNSLKQLFEPISPAIKIYTNYTQTELKPDDLIPKDTANYESVFWQHYGVGNKLISEHNYYFSKIAGYDKNDPLFGRLKIYPTPGKFYIYKLNEDISVSMPHALYSGDSITYPDANKNDLENLLNKLNDLGNDFTYSNPDVRNGCIVITWNTIQHFFPYFDVVKTDWDRSLQDAFKRTEKDASNDDFKRTLRKMIATLNDGHVWVSDGQSNGKIYSPPFEWLWIEDSLVITKILNDSTGLKPGDIILEINGIKTIDALEEEEQYIPGSTIGWKRLNYSRRSPVISVLLGEINTELKLKVKSSGGAEKTVTVITKETREFSKTKNEPDRIKAPGGGILYIDLTSINTEELEKSMDKMTEAKGIIFEMRGYPSKCDPDFLRHLTGAKLTSALWNIPITVFPDRQNVVFEVSGVWEMEPLKPRITANIVFITNANAISYAESVMGIVEAYKLGEIVGEPTAGTNGNVNTFMLPCGYTVQWTGMKVLKHDGTQHHGIGILPTVPCSPTIKGVLEGRDEQLEKAIEVVKAKIR